MKFIIKWLRKKITFIILLFSFLLLNSCTSVILKAVYNNADWFIVNQVDKFLDLTWRQDSFLMTELEDFLIWHRKEGLQEIYQFMGKVETKLLMEEVTLNDIYDLTNSFQLLLVNTMDPLLESLTTVVETIEDDQVDYLVGILGEEIKPRVGKDGKTYQERTDQENYEYILEQRIKTTQTWFNSITPEQIAILEEFSVYNRNHSDIRYRQRQHASKIFIDFIYKKPTSKQLKELLLSWIKNPKLIQLQEYRNYLESRRITFFNEIVRFHKTFTQEQKMFFIKKLDNYKKIVIDLQKDS